MIKLAIWLLCILAISASPVKGKEKLQPFYPAALITPALKLDAWAVCRDYKQEFNLISDGKAIEHVHMVITILEKNGDEYAELELPYDKSRKVSSISGRLYDQEGLRDDKLKSNTIQDINYTSEGTIYDDLRIKLAKLKGGSYPYTVEYDYEISYEGLIGYPDWRPVSGYRFSVERATFVFTCPQIMEFRYREFNIPSGSRTEHNEKGTKQLEWKVDSLTAMREEPFSPRLSLQTPHVMTAPLTFEYYNYKGSMSSWNNFGMWINTLIQGRDQLPQQRENEIRELVKGIKDTTSIVKKLYEYMQSRTHYVGIQLGIGGFQPFPAETVDKLGYGDCKALTIYMKALLNAAGIRSDYTIAGADSNQGITMPDFPTINQCNHVILCIPNRRDTIWLECTSQTAPLGYMSTFTAGRNGLIVYGNGGRIVKVPLLTAAESSQFRKAEIQINPDGELHATLNTTYRGYQYDNISQLLVESKKEQEKAIYENIPVNGMVVTDFNYQNNKDKIPQAIENVTLSSKASTTKSGKRLFIPINLFNQLRSIPAKVDNRKMPVYLAMAYLNKDSVWIQLPDGFKPESIPQNRKYSSDFGEYTSSVRLENNRLLYMRIFKRNRGTWPKEKYGELIDFYTSILNADKAKIVLKEQ